MLNNLSSLNLSIIYLCIVNIVAIIMCVSDKERSKRELYRISEKALFMISALGGAIAMYATMKIIRHKTKHRRFMIGLPIIIIFQIIAVIFYFLKKI